MMQDGALTAVSQRDEMVMMKQYHGCYDASNQPWVDDSSGTGSARLPVATGSKEPQC